MLSPNNSLNTAETVWDIVCSDSDRPDTGEVGGLPVWGALIVSSITV